VIDGQTECRLCGASVRVAETDDGRRVVLNANGGVSRGEGRYLLDDEHPTRALAVSRRTRDTRTSSIERPAPTASEIERVRRTIRARREAAGRHHRGGNRESTKPSSRSTRTSKSTAKTATKKPAAKRARPKKSERQRLRESVAAGRKDLATVLRDRPRTIRSLEVGEVLQFDPAINSTLAARVLRGITYPHVKVSELTDAQIARIGAALTIEVPGPRAASLRAA
jgi:hypothetical protein